MAFIINGGNMGNPMNEEEKKVLWELEKECGVPEGFLTEIINLEKEHLFQLKRRNVIKKIEDIIADHIED